MAKETDVKNDTEKKPDNSQPSVGFGIFTWLILGAVVLAGATGGFALSQLMGGQTPASSETAAPAEQKPNKAFDDLLAQQTAKGATSWMYDTMEPVLANLDEPGVTRYVRVTVSLELSPEMDQEKGKAFLDQRTMLLRDWLTTYFAGLSLEEVRGSRNLNRIKREVQDQFNTLLFPGTKPLIQQVLFKEFAVQ
jgi:flagellar basal body-associated protein FliL